MAERPQPVQRQRCENCWYSRPAGGDQEQEYVRCHHDPPDITAALLEPVEWPLVRRAAWCGSWRTNLEYRFT